MTVSSDLFISSWGYVPLSFISWGLPDQHLHDSSKRAGGEAGIRTARKFRIFSKRYYKTMAFRILLIILPEEITSMMLIKQLILLLKGVQIRQVH